MRKFLFAICVALCLAFAVNAQTTTQTGTTDTTTTKKRNPTFRATKSQITEAQKALKDKGLYGGEATGKLDDDSRTAIKKFQESNGLKQTGTLNRSTLEKMNIKLTETQLAIPFDASTQMASSDNKTSSTTKKRGPVFRANKDQVTEAQTMLKTKGLYSGEATGKLDDDTRAALKKYQEAEKIKVTGTLNRETLEKMGIALTDKQKEMTMTKTN
jgi:peptidoglycan hydrolase-like protein with peptidoglycan-binding domain